jgi:SAM-dependent methyltransferase
MRTVSHDREASPIGGLLGSLRCPQEGAELRYDGRKLICAYGHSYRVDCGIPLFAEQFCSEDAKSQRDHYDKIAAAYSANLGYPQTEEYMAYLDRALCAIIDRRNLGTVAEICCGLGEAFKLLGHDIDCGIGIDVSAVMLRSAAAQHGDGRFVFLQADATALPLAPASVDTVFMLGGIHHVNNRRKLFVEIARILRPGGRFYFREPVSDFVLWRAIRSIVYRLSPLLDYNTERPLRYNETVPLLEAAGLRPSRWETHGLLGFCLFMNADVLVFNRLFRFVPQIRAITRAAARLDEWTIGMPGLARAGLQVIGSAQKPLA